VDRAATVVNRDVDPRGVYSIQKRRTRPDLSTGRYPLTTGIN
jgi:hypothetical protein